MEFVLIALVGIIVSAFGTVVGFGGGVFMVPLLIILFHVPINVAIGSVILALLPGSLISTYFNYKAKQIDFLAGIILEAPTMVGTVIGAYLTSIIPVFLIEIIFSLFISWIGIYMFRKAKHGDAEVDKSSKLYKLNRLGPGIIRRSKKGAYRISFLLCGIFGIMAGILAGFFGIGGGFLKIPIMVGVFNIPPLIASSTALFMIVFTSFTGSASHYFLGHIYFQSSFPVVIGFIMGAFIGNKLNVKVSDKTLRKLIGIGLLLAGFAVFIYAVVLRYIIK